MKPTGCIRCGAQASHVLHPLELVACVDCYLLWIRDEECSLESILRALNFTGDPTRYTKAQGSAIDAELERRTIAWARAGREAA